MINEARKRNSQVMSNTMLLDAGMKHLSEKLGLVEAERFISLLLQEPFDYTKWRMDSLFTGMSMMEISEAAKQYCDENPDA